MTTKSVANDHVASLLALANLKSAKHKGIATMSCCCLMNVPPSKTNAGGTSAMNDVDPLFRASRPATTRPATSMATNVNVPAPIARCSGT